MNQLDKLKEVAARMKEIQAIYNLSEAEFELLMQLYAILTAHVSYSKPLKLKLFKALGALEEALQDIIEKYKEDDK